GVMYNNQAIHQTYSNQSAVEHGTSVCRIQQSTRQGGAPYTVTGKQTPRRNRIAFREGFKGKEGWTLNSPWTQISTLPLYKALVYLLFIKTNFSLSLLKFTLFRPNHETLQGRISKTGVCQAIY